MTRGDFEATWYPRIGKDAAEELRRARRVIGILSVVGPVCAVGGGLLIGSGEHVLGYIAVTVAAGYIVMYLRAQARVAKALSMWFGVRIRGLPRMTPTNFDEAVQRYGWRTPEQRTAAIQASRSARGIDTGVGKGPEDPPPEDEPPPAQAPAPGRRAC